jgi:probable phosphoglycerate mutase
MERLIYVARHGETDWNASGRWQGQTDIPLNEVGRAQARALGAGLKGRGIVSAGSSDLSRAKETAAIAARALGLEVTYTDAALRERAYGVFEGLTRAECVERYPLEWASFDAAGGAAPAGVEPLEHLTARMLRGLRAASEQMHAPALLVSHGRAMRSLVTAILGRPVDPIPNGGVYRVVVAAGVPVDAAPLTGSR